MMYSVVTGIIACLALHNRPVRGDTAVFLAGLILFANFITNCLSGCALVVSLTGALLSEWYIVLSLATATIAYRISPWHPLARFPGPLINKITSLRLMYIVASGRRHLTIEELHQKYGKFVRTGPNTLSINSYAAVGPIYANANAFDRSDAYMLPGSAAEGIFFMTSRVRHAVHRRFWARGFTPQSLTDYGPRLTKRAIQFLNCVAERADGDGVVNIGQCIRHWAYDVMGDITFGGSNRLELMEEGDPRDLVHSGQIATCVVEILGEMPSLFQVLWYLPATHVLRRLEDLAYGMMVKRRAAGSGLESDLSTHILEGNDKITAFQDESLRLDSLFVIQAGSDATTGVVILSTYHLVSHPDVMEKLRKELDATFPDGEGLSIQALSELEYLDAVVNECMRLGSPFPGLPRVVPPEGTVLDDVYVPGGTIVGVPIYAQVVSEENFWPEPKAFIPERWFTGGLGPDTRTRRSALATFSYGPFGCLGKGLAVQEMKQLIAHLILAYDLKFAPDFIPEAFEAGVTNRRTTMFSYPLRVIATPRA